MYSTFKNTFTFALLSFLLALPAINSARAVVEIDISRGNVEPLPIAITQFASTTSAGKDISTVITNDLKRSGLFKPIDRLAFIEKGLNASKTPRFSDWKAINAQALVTGSITKENDGRLKAVFRLWDTFAGKQIIGQQFFSEKENWRRIAHIIADTVYERLTGEKGYFDTRIVFVSENGPKNQRIKRLAIMDQDGANMRPLTSGKHLVLTPRFSPNRQEITYISYENGRPSVYLMQLETGQREIVGEFPGMTISSRFSPKGERIIFSFLQEGRSNIYTLDLRSRKTTRLTSTNAIDIAPSYSPDGKKISFASDRSGPQQIYTMNANGSNQRRISFGDGTYSTPVWSPRGDLIAFTKKSGRDFAIGVMRPDGKGERILATSFSIEGPTWAPNGRILMYFKKNAGDSGSKLYTIDLTGYNEQPVPTPEFGSDPAWSPLLE